MRNQTGYVFYCETEIHLNDGMIDQLIQRIRGCGIHYSLERTPIDNIVISGPESDLIVHPTSRHWSFLCDWAEDKASLAHDYYGLNCNECGATHTWDGGCACV
jgi:hypothetical protein